MKKIESRQYDTDGWKYREEVPSWMSGWVVITLRYVSLTDLDSDNRYSCVHTWARRGGDWESVGCVGVVFKNVQSGFQTDDFISVE